MENGIGWKKDYRQLYFFFSYLVVGFTLSFAAATWFHQINTMQLFVLLAKYNAMMMNNFSWFIYMDRAYKFSFVSDTGLRFLHLHIQIKRRSKGENDGNLNSFLFNLYTAYLSIISRMHLLVFNSFQFPRYTWFARRPAIHSNLFSMHQHFLVHSTLKSITNNTENLKGWFVQCNTSNALLEHPTTTEHWFGRSVSWNACTTNPNGPGVSIQLVQPFLNSI